MKKLLFASILAMMTIAMASCDNDSEKKPARLPSSLEKVTGLKLDTNGMLTWDAVKDAQYYTLTCVKEIPIIGSFESIIAENIMQNRIQLGDSLADQWQTLYVYAEADNEFGYVESDRSDPYECVWVRNKTLLSQPSVIDIQLIDSTLVNKKGEEKTFKAYVAKVSDIDPKASSVDVYTKSSIPLSESTMHLSSLSRFNLDGMTPNADGSYRIAGTTSITPPSTGDIEIAFQAVPSEENADKYIPSAKTVRTLKF